MAIAGTGGLFIFCCALLWALLGLPIDRTQGVANKRTLLLEAACTYQPYSGGPRRLCEK